MRPVKLEIEGVKSFIEKVSIDFEELLSDGLFGIFGDTGSGKSTILDCIILALYGRMGKTVQKTEFINSKCYKASVEYTFKITVFGERKTYRVKREFSLNAKRESKDVKAFLYEHNASDVVLIEEGAQRVTDKINDILGIGFEEFQKCIALPQGEFSSFVKSTRIERLAIVGKLFDLERYGDKLISKIKRREEEVEDVLTENRGALSVIEPVTKEEIENSEKEHNDTNAKLNDINEKLSKIDENIDKNKSFYDLSRQLKSKGAELSELEKKKEEYLKKKQDTQLIEPALKIKKDIDEYKERSKNFSEDKKRLDAIDEQLKRLGEEYDKVARDYSGLEDLRKEIEKNNLFIKTIDFWQPSILKKDQKEKDLELAKSEAENCNKRILYLASEIEKKKQNYDECSCIYEEEYGDDRINFYLIKLNDDRLKKYVSDQLEKYRKISKDILNFETNSELYKYVEKCIQTAICECKNTLSQLGIEEQSSDAYSLTEFKIFLENKDEEYKKLCAKADEIRKIESKIDIEKNNLDNLNSKISELEKEIADLDVSIKKELGEENPAELKKKTLQVITVLDRKAKETEKNYRDLEAKKSEREKEHSRLLGAVTIAEDYLKASESSIKEQMQDKFANTGEVTSFIAKYGDGKRLKEEVENYYIKYNSALQFVKESQETLNSSGFSQEKYEDLLNQKKMLTDEQLALTKNLGILTENIKKKKENFENRCIIEEIISTKRAEYDKIDTLHKLVKSKKLMEFIADEYLGEIALNAERTLKTLTCGRYGLKYSDNFYVLDNYNGGAERSVSSLSGGETFLVSLSLALSMSQEIYSKSNRPIEFFFLDEGFGTLDNTLVETVLESLEKLKNSDFTIGVISHVQELKQRINRKITVISATRTSGSRIDIGA